MSNDTYVTCVGNLTEDPTLRFTANGLSVVNFTVASTPRYYDNGSWKDGEALFMRCTLWKEAAENVHESLTRGARVIVYGKLKQRSWESDGQKRTSVELEVEEIGPSLRFVTAKVFKKHSMAGKAADPWGDPAEAPF